jgi:predicted glycosyltransferase
MFYSHDGLGLGHTRRHLAVAAALAELEPRASILLATGADYVARLGVPRQVEVLKLPGLRKIGNDQYCSRHLQIPGTEIRALRSALLLATVKGFRPDVVLVDKHPFGASGEFKAGLKALRRQGGRAMLGFRDILDDPEQVRREWHPYRMQQRIAKHFDQVLVYGERAVFDPVSAYDFPAGMAARTRFCGYVINDERQIVLPEVRAPFPERAGRTRPVVLATAGGGEDGFRMLETFIRAAADAPWQGCVVAGPMTPDVELAELERLAEQCGVIFRAFVPHLSLLFDSADALVCMGGYNTLTEAVYHGVPTVCVPRTAPRREQLIRAEAFARLGLLQVCPPTELHPAWLGQKVEAALLQSRAHLQARALAKLHFDGARQAARHLLQLSRETIAHEKAPALAAA